ncbi:MAG: class I tRNA ligase family protein, partial [Moraxella sp.]|nr:class I tRNA ligase family protein [Moraxella sp.]
EEIWTKIAPLIGKGDKSGDETIMLADYPVANPERINETAENDMNWLQGLIGAVRNIRGEMNLGNAKLLPVLLQNINEGEKTQIQRIEPLFKALAKVESLTFLANDEKAPLSSSSVIGQAVVYVPMKGLIDPAVELARLNKELEKLQKQYDQIANKLANESFVAKAPPAVVSAEREKLSELEGQIGKVKESMGEIEAL